MIYLIPDGQQTMFVMLSESDVGTMRQGGTIFVDKRGLAGHVFDKVIISLSSTDHATREMLAKLGHVTADSLQMHEPEGNEVRCKVCSGINNPAHLLEDTCILCWAHEAKMHRVRRN